MIQLNNDEFEDWVANCPWLCHPDPSSWRFEVKAGTRVKRYECEIAEGSSFVGCNMARLFLHDIETPKFAGGLFWIVRTFPPDKDMLLFARQVLRGFGIPDSDPRFEYFLLDKGEYEACFALCALAMMFGWDANFVAAEGHFWLEMDDEPFPALITDKISASFAAVVESLKFKITEIVPQ
jgi:hypothetical protein